MYNPNAANNAFGSRQIIPFGMSLDRYSNRHLIDQSVIPYAVNARLKMGQVEKRPGRTTIYNFIDEIAPGTQILGVFPANENICLVFTGINNAALGAQTGKVYEWNYITDSSAAAFVMKDITPTIYGGAIGLYDSNWWRCCNHYDNASGDVMTICTNGWDHILKYVHTGGTGGATGVLSTLISSVDIAAGTYYKGLYVQSFYDAVYLANITDVGYWMATAIAFTSGKEFSTGVDGIRDGDTIMGETSGAQATISTGGVHHTSGTWAGGNEAGTLDLENIIGNFIDGETFQVTHSGSTVADIATLTYGTTTDVYAVVWSKVADAADFSVANNYQQRTEDGLPITALQKYSGASLGYIDDVLMLGKGGNKSNNQIWIIRPYNNFICLQPKRGPSNNDGNVMTASGELFINDKGRILNMAGEEVSLPISTQVKISDPGVWDLVAIDKEYDDEVIFSGGKSIFIYKRRQKTWQIDTYPQKVRACFALTAGRAAEQLVGLPSRHTAISAAEEDTVSDLVFIYNNSSLCVSNHFSDDDGEDIEFEVQTFTFPVAGALGQKGRIGEITLYGAPNTDAAPNGPFNLYGFFSDSPSYPQWTSLGTFTLDTEGKASAWWRIRATWAAFRVVCQDSNAVKLFYIDVSAQPSGSR